MAYERNRIVRESEAMASLLRSRVAMTVMRLDTRRGNQAAAARRTSNQRELFESRYLRLLYDRESASGRINVAKSMHLAGRGD